jgi:hypothetical protein
MAEIGKQMVEIALPVGKQQGRQDAGKDQADSNEKEHLSRSAFLLLLHAETRTPRFPPAQASRCPIAGAFDPCQIILARVAGEIVDVRQPVCRFVQAEMIT